MRLGKLGIAFSRLGGGRDRPGAPPAPSAPVNMVAPVVSGTLTQGEVLSSTIGTWSGTDPITFTRQWYRVDNSWTPAQLTSLKGWYKGDTLAGADGSAVASWTDASGLGNNATPSGSPTLQTAEQNGLNVVQLNGTTQYFTLANLLAGATAAAGVFVTRATGTPGTAQGGVLKFGSDISNNGNNHYPFTSNEVYDDFASNSRKTVGAVTGVTSWHIGSFHSTANSFKYFKDGTQVFTTATNTFDFRTSPYIGRGTRGTGENYYGGMIGEIVIVNEFLSDANRQKIEGYLAHKWGLAGSLPGGHPWKSSPPT